MPDFRTEAHQGRAEYLAAKAGRLGAVTLDASTFTPDPLTGELEQQPGLLLARIAGTNLWGPYDPLVLDGRQISTDNLLILHEYVDLADGVDREVSVLLEGHAVTERVLTEAGVAITALLQQDMIISKLCKVTFTSIGL